MSRTSTATRAGAGRPAPAPIVRRIRATDAARLRALRLEMLADSPLVFLETLAEAAQRPHTEFAQLAAESADGPAVARFVIERNGRLIGHVGGAIRPADGTATVVFAVYLTPAHRGQGLLAELFDALAAWSCSAGRPELLLEVMVGNHRAIRAYERLGFVDTGIRVPHPRIPVLTELQMRRPA
jgi:RimJ/RimL family protein N-acetyltransferase